MLSLASCLGKIESTIYPQPFNRPSPSFKNISEAGEDINQLRMLPRGDLKTCLNLFKEAVIINDVIVQIQLSMTLHAMKQNKDHEKDFHLLSIDQLEKFFHYPRNFELYNSAYDESMEIKSDWQVHIKRGVDAFNLAAAQNYLPAILELNYTNWVPNERSYGFAVELRRYVGNGNSELDYYFGQALQYGCQTGSKLFYEGLYWMNQSKRIDIKYPEESQSFEEFKTHYLTFIDCTHSYYDGDGFLYIGCVVLAPSKQKWDEFVQAKLRNFVVTPIDDYFFTYDSEQLKDLLNQFRIKVSGGPSPIDFAHEGSEIENLFGEKLHGFAIEKLSIYKDEQYMSEISVRNDGFKIHQTFEDADIQPLIDFMENILTRTGSAFSVISWLKHLGSFYT